MNRRHFIAALALLPYATTFIPAARAGVRLPFDAAAFAEAQKAGGPILVDIAADWCPTCRAQKPIVDGLLSLPGNEALLVFEVDFDTQANIVRGFGARSQSTLIAFRGTKETGRSVGDTDPTSIAALVRGATMP